MFLSILDCLVLSLLTAYVDSTNEHNIDTTNERPMHFRLTQSQGEKIESDIEDM